MYRVVERKQGNKIWKNKKVETISVNWQTRTNWAYCELGINKN